MKLLKTQISKRDTRRTLSEQRKWCLRSHERRNRLEKVTKCLSGVKTDPNSNRPFCLAAKEALPVLMRAFVERSE